GLTRRLFEPHTHWPKARLAGTTGQRRILIENLGGLTCEQKNIERRGVRYQLVYIRIAIANVVFDPTETVDIEAPAQRAPGQRQHTTLAMAILMYTSWYRT